MKYIKRLGWLITAPIALAIIGIAIANRHSVQISLDPFSVEAPALSLEMPLWLALFGTLLLGVVIGGFSSWTAHARRTLKRRGRDKEQQKATTNAEKPFEDLPQIVTGSPTAPMLQPPRIESSGR